MSSIQSLDPASRLLNASQLAAASQKRTSHADKANFGATSAQPTRTNVQSFTQQQRGSTELIERLQGLGVRLRQLTATEQPQGAQAEQIVPSSTPRVDPTATASQGQPGGLQSFAANFGSQDATASEGDLNGDGVIDLADFALFAQRESERVGPARSEQPDIDTIRQNFGLEDATYENGDLNEDGRVDLEDLAMAARASLDETA